MNKKRRKWIITASLLILAGIIIMGGAATMAKWNFSNFQTSNFETNEHQIREKFENVSIVCDTADIEFVVSSSGNTTVICHEKPNSKHEVSVTDKTLEIKLIDERKWYEHIGINFKNPSITVQLPESNYGSIYVKSSTGDVETASAFTFETIDISVNTGDIVCLSSAKGNMKLNANTGDIKTENISVTELELSATTGHITASGVTCTEDVSIRVTTGKTVLENVTCKNLTAQGNTGDISLKNVVASGKLSDKRDTGDVRFEKCDASEISIVTDTGDIRGTLLSEKIFHATSDTGKINVPKTTSGGKCEVSTDTGSINIEIEN